MKKLLFLFLVLTSFVRSQTLIAYDYIETQNWGTGGSGWAVGCGACWYSNTISVTPTNSGLLVGNGKSSSPDELGTYILTNITGLNPNTTYLFRFRASANNLSSPLAATAGNDVGDYFDVRYSSNNGSTWTTEMRVTGFSNATWGYNTMGVASKTTNGSMTTYTPVAGGDRTSTGDGYSVIELALPLGITQVRFQIPTRVNSEGEEWWFDNFELWDMAIVALPVELISFNGKNINNSNLITWSTATESNSDYFLVEKSSTGNDDDFKPVGIINSAGNSTQVINYQLEDNDYEKQINYYRLSQYDNDGLFKTYPTISIDNRRSKENVIKTINLLGQEVDENYKGIVILVYEDGTSKKVIR